MKNRILRVTQHAGHYGFDTAACTQIDRPGAAANRGGESDVYDYIVRTSCNYPTEASAIVQCDRSVFRNW